MTKQTTIPKAKPLAENSIEEADNAEINTSDISIEKVDDIAENNTTSENSIDEANNNTESKTSAAEISFEKVDNIAENNTPSENSIDEANNNTENKTSAAEISIEEADNKTSAAEISIEEADNNNPEHNIAFSVQNNLEPSLDTDFEASYTNLNADLNLVVTDFMTDFPSRVIQTGDGTVVTSKAIQTPDPDDVTDVSSKAIQTPDPDDGTAADKITETSNMEKDTSVETIFDASQVKDVDNVNFEAAKEENKIEVTKDDSQQLQVIEI